MGPKKQAAALIPVKRDALKGKKVIITGEIDGQSRKSAEQILINAGATIEKSLNKASFWATNPFLATLTDYTSITAEGRVGCVR